MTEHNILSISKLHQQANYGDAQAQYDTNGHHSENKDAAANQDFASTWLTEAEQHGISYAEAHFLLGRCYSKGIGVEKDEQKAVEWYVKAAEQGFADAQSTLAHCYMKGIGVKQSEETATEWFEKMCESEEKPTQRMHSKATTDALVKLGDLYSNGENVGQCGDFAFMLYETAYEKAEENNGSEAAYRLSLCYLEGKGVEKDCDMSWKMLNEAAMQNHQLAKNKIAKEYYLMGHNYYAGQPGYDRNYQIAIQWFTKASELDYADAYSVLGILYQHGVGVEQNGESAFECYKKAIYLYENKPNSEYVHKNFTYFLLANCYAIGIGVEKNELKAQSYLNCFNYDEMRGFVESYMSDLTEMPPSIGIAKEMLHLRLSIHNSKGQFEDAEEFVNKVFENAKGDDTSYKEVCLTTIKQAKNLQEKNQELEAKNKQLESEIKQKEEAYIALHEKEKEMLSFFTHTMRNALATAPESLRQAIYLLGGEDYDKDNKHYQAINKIAALFSTLSLTDCLIDTFKQSISDPQEFKQAWQNDHSGDATPQWVIASSLRQSLNRIMFMSDASDFKKLLKTPETALIKATRKSFIEEILPLTVDQTAVNLFYGWVRQHIPCLDVTITNMDNVNFGVNQTRFSLLFAITSELILNALKYWDGEHNIQVSWHLKDSKETLNKLTSSVIRQAHHERNQSLAVRPEPVEGLNQSFLKRYVFCVKNHCKPNASSNLAGTHKGLAFIQRLVELLGEEAKFSCTTDGQFFTAELTLNKTLFDGD